MNIPYICPYTVVLLFVVPLVRFAIVLLVILTVPELPKVAIPYTFWASVAEAELALMLLDVEILPMVLLLREQTVPLELKQIP